MDEGFQSRRTQLVAVMALASFMILGAITFQTYGSHNVSMHHSGRHLQGGMVKEGVIEVTVIENEDSPPAVSSEDSEISESSIEEEDSSSEEAEDTSAESETEGTDSTEDQNTMEDTTEGSTTTTAGAGETQGEASEAKGTDSEPEAETQGSQSPYFEASLADDGSTPWPEATDRCEWVIQQMNDHNAWMTREQLKSRYQIQLADAGNFFRSTTQIFWKDFVSGHWSLALLPPSIRDDSALEERTALNEYSLWTWISGDQHLENFGSWKNRHGDVVFSMNDFDEAAIYDFQVDVARLAVSIWDQALLENGLHIQQATQAVRAMVNTYVETVMNYVGNENALLFELTRHTATGEVKDFLEDVEDDGSTDYQMSKYTEVDSKGNRRFRTGTRENPRKKLAALPQADKDKVRKAFTASQYGATWMKLGWAVDGTWDDDSFEVLDVAARIGSGVGSYGVDRYYVLLRGGERSDGHPIILDVKHVTPGSVNNVLTPVEEAWYSNLFPHSAAMAIEAERQLTSYTDPFSGWVEIPDSSGTLQPFSVRRRSPWKDDPDIEDITDPEDYVEFASQVAVTMATSHVRGSVAKPPGDFKNVITGVLRKGKHRLDWAKRMVQLAKAYHGQLALDYKCFKDYVDKNF